MMMRSATLLFNTVVLLGCFCKGFQHRNPFIPDLKSAIKTNDMTLRMSVPNPLDTLTSGLASICRLPKGVTVSSNLKKKNANGSNDEDDGDTIRLLKLYDIENSRECRSVRETITELDLVVEKVIPAAENSRSRKDSSYKDALPQGAPVPTLVVSSNNGKEEQTLSGEEKIVTFLEDSFLESPTGQSTEEEELSQQVLSALLEAGSFVASLLRLGRGESVSAAVTSPGNVQRPEKPIILYSYEGNQFCRLVREVLTELDIVYELRSAGKESPRRSELADLTGGSSQCPYIVDPNTGVSMSESADIISYLYKTYALWTPPYALLEWGSENVMGLLKPLFSTLAPVQAGSNGEDTQSYEKDVQNAMSKIKKETAATPVVIYTYDLSPFCTEATALLRNLDVNFKEVSLGKEWIPGLITDDGALKRAALLQETGQSSLPHIFVGGESLGGLFGERSIIASLKSGEFLQKVKAAEGGKSNGKEPVTDDESIGAFE